MTHIQQMQEKFRAKWEGANTFDTAICTPMMNEMLEDIAEVVKETRKEEQINVLREIEKHAVVGAVNYGSAINRYMRDNGISEESIIPTPPDKEELSK